MSDTAVDNQRLVSIFESWLTLHSTKEEVESMEKLRSFLCDSEDAFQLSLTEFNQLAFIAQLDLCEQQHLDWFVFFLFDRRFGWPDLKEEDGLLVVTRPERHGRSRRSGRQEELRHKQRLVDCLDSLIGWLLQQPADWLAVSAMASASRLAANAPVTRCQLVLRAFDWLREKLRCPDQETFDAVCDLVCQSLGDVWSQIRGSAVARIGAIVDELSLEHIQLLFQRVAALCENAEGCRWQQVDGGVSGIHAMVKRFQRVGFSVELSASGSFSPRVNSQVKIGKHLLDKLPLYVHHRVKELAFSLVADEQLGIRETAVKALVACLVCCGADETESAFHDVYHRLAVCCEGLDSFDCPVLSDNFQFMEPYCAESLLHLCLQLFKRLRDHQSIQQNWAIYHRVLEVYLMHPASSVRQAASSLYTYVIARSVSSPQLVKYILYCLMRKWRPDQQVLLQPLATKLPAAARASITDNDEEAVGVESEAWEWREGRLLVCELVCKLLLKNHSLCVTGLAASRKSDSANQRRGSMRQRAARRSRCSTISESNFRPGEEFPSLTERQSLGRRSSQSDGSEHAANHRLDTIESGQVQNYISPVSFLVQVKRSDSPANSPPSSPSPSPHSSSESLPPFRSLLCQMLHTCAESMADTSWELRRMGRQAFASVGQLLFAFDRKLFDRTVSTHLSSQPSVMTFCSLCLVRDVALQQQLAEDEEEQQETQRQWLASCRHYATELPLHCVTVVAVDILLILRDNDDSWLRCLQCIDSALTEQPNAEIDLTLVCTLSVSANPVELLLTLLRCCGKHMLHFVQASDSCSSIAQLLPLAIKWLQVCSTQRIDSSEASRHLIACIACISDKLSNEASVAAAVDAAVSQALLLIAELLESRAAAWRLHRRQLLPALCRLLSMLKGMSLAAGDALPKLISAAADLLIDIPTAAAAANAGTANRSSSSCTNRSYTKRQQFQLFASQSTVLSDELLDSVSIGSDSEADSLVEDAQPISSGPLPSAAPANAGDTHSAASSSSSGWDSTSSGSDVIEAAAAAAAAAVGDDNECRVIGEADRQFAQDAADVVASLSSCAADLLTQTAESLTEQQRLRVRAVAQR